VRRQAIFFKNAVRKRAANMSSETGRVNESLVFDHKMESAVFIRKKKKKKQGLTMNRFKTMGGHSKNLLRSS
jgi:hypothetical protein